MHEYKILIKAPDEAQKALNQWRHNYIVEVVKTSYHANIDRVFMLIKRRRKE